MTDFGNPFAVRKQKENISAIMPIVDNTPKMNNIMLDLETMGTGPNAAIVAIGAVAFDKNELGRDFYLAISLGSAVEAGGIMDASTVEWWLQQSEEAKKVFSGRTTNHFEALVLFRDWINNYFEPRNVNIWGNGANFDNVILAQAYKKDTMPGTMEIYE